MDINGGIRNEKITEELEAKTFLDAQLWLEDILSPRRQHNPVSVSALIAQVSWGYGLNM